MLNKQLITMIKMKNLKKLKKYYLIVMRKKNNRVKLYYIN